MLLMVGRPTTWGANRQTSNWPSWNFQNHVSCWVQQQVTFCASKDSSWLQPVAPLWGVFGGLVPSQKSCKSPRL